MNLFLAIPASIHYTNALFNYQGYSPDYLISSPPCFTERNEVKLLNPKGAL
jgi:hypothetical protein